jgi:1-acyl-sn-glycerol-3-phosphate acyltransferase
MSSQNYRLESPMSKNINIPHIDNNIPRLGNRFSEWLGKTVLSAMGWSFSGQFPTHRKMVITVAPHTSNWDFVLGLAVAFSLRLKISFFGKHSIFIPPFDRLLKRWGGIPIERSQTHGVVTQMTDKMIEADQMVLCLSPEGTRSKITQWKTGFLHIAHKSNVPVFLVGLDYGKKQVLLGESLMISENIPAEMNKIYQYYANVQAKFPDQVSCPLETFVDK